MNLKTKANEELFNSLLNLIKDNPMLARPLNNHKGLVQNDMIVPRADIIMASVLARDAIRRTQRESDESFTAALNMINEIQVYLLESESAD